jgi:hypothetical protein
MDGSQSSKTNMDFWQTQKSYIGLGCVSSDITFLRPSKIHIGLQTIHYLYSDMPIMRSSLDSSWHKYNCVIFLSSCIGLDFLIVDNYNISLGLHGFCVIV